MTPSPLIRDSPSPQNLTEGCALELAVSGDIVIFANSTVLADLFRLQEWTLNTVAGSHPGSVTDRESLDKVDDQKSGNHESRAHEIPIQALLTAPCLRMVMWNTFAEPTVAQLIVDLIHPHLIVEHSLQLGSWTDRVEFVIHDVQVRGVHFFVLVSVVVVFELKCCTRNMD